jgi:hypothetical protein
MEWIDDRLSVFGDTAAVAVARGANEDGEMSSGEA